MKVKKLFLQYLNMIMRKLNFMSTGVHSADALPESIRGAVQDTCIGQRISDFGYALQLLQIR